MAYAEESNPFDRDPPSRIQPQDHRETDGRHRGKILGVAGSSR